MDCWGKKLLAIHSRVQQCLELVGSERDGSRLADGRAKAGVEDQGRVERLLSGVQTSLDEVLGRLGRVEVIPA